MTAHTVYLDNASIINLPASLSRCISIGLHHCACWISHSSLPLSLFGPTLSSSPAVHLPHPPPCISLAFSFLSPCGLLFISPSYPSSSSPFPLSLSLPFTMPPHPTHTSSSPLHPLPVSAFHSLLLLLLFLHLPQLSLSLSQPSSASPLSSVQCPPPSFFCSCHLAGQWSQTAGVQGVTGPAGQRVTQISGVCVCVCMCDETRRRSGVGGLSSKSLERH